MYLVLARPSQAASPGVHQGSPAHLDSISAPHVKPIRIQIHSNCTQTNPLPTKEPHRCRRRQPNSQRHPPICCRWMPNPLCILLFTPSHSFPPEASFFSLLCSFFPPPRPLRSRLAQLPAPTRHSRVHTTRARSIAAVLPPAEERTCCQHCSCFPLGFRFPTATHIPTKYGFRLLTSYTQLHWMKERLVSKQKRKDI